MAYSKTKHPAALRPGEVSALAALDAPFAMRITLIN